MASNPTAAVIIGLARNLLRSESTSDVPVIQDSFMLQALSDANIKWARSFGGGSGVEPIFFQRDFGIDLVADTTLAANCATTDVTLTLTTSASFPTASSLVVWDDAMPDVIQYTGNNLTTTLSGVTNIGFAHETGDRVQLLYALPSNFGSFRASSIYGDGVMVNGIPYYFMGGVPTPGYFSMIDDGTTKYLWLAPGMSGSCSVLYNKSSSTIASLSDVVDVPIDFQFFLVWHLVAFGFMGREQDMNAMKSAQEQSRMILQEALQNRNIGKKIRTRVFGRRNLTMVNGSYYPAYY